MSLKQEFNASVIYQLHSNPPRLGLHSKELGYTEIYLGDLDLTQDEIDALCDAQNVTGTFELRDEPKAIYVINEAAKDPSKGMQNSAWKVKSIKPA